MKKLLAIFLTVVMLVLSVASAIPVFAADGPFVVGGTNYATLTEAVANASANDTIYLTADYTSADDVGIAVDKALKIKSVEGQKYTVTITANAVPSSYWISSSANLSIEDINVVTTLGFGVTGGEFTLKNSTVDMSLEYTAATGGGTLAVIHISGGAKVTLDKATVTHEVDTKDANVSVGSQTVYIKGDGSSLELTENSSITSKSRSSTTASGRYMIMVSCKDQSTTLTTNASIKVGEGCSLVNETVLGTRLRPAGIFYMSNVGNDHVVNINLENGSVLDINTKLNTYNTYTSGFVYGSGYTLTDNGCEYRVNSAVAGDVYFPTVTNAASGDCFYTMDGVTVANGGNYTVVEDTQYSFKFGEYTDAFSIDGKNDTYETLTDAVAAAEAGDTILLTRDYGSATDVDITVDKALTIKSAGTEKYKITITADPSPLARWITASGALTIENIDVVTTRGIEITSGNFLLKNSVFDMKCDNNTTSQDKAQGEYAFIVLKGGSTATLSGATVTHELNTGNGEVGTHSCVVHIQGSEKNTFTMTDNSSITSNSDTTNSTMNTLIEVDRVDDTTGSVAEINVGEGCALKNNMNMGTTQGIRPVSIFFDRRKATTEGMDITVNLAKDSALEIYANIVTYSTTTPGWMNGGSGFADDYTINDSGCEYIVKSPAKKSNSGNIKDGCLMYFPTVADESGEKKFYATNAEPVANGGTMELTAGTVYTFKFGDGTPVVENGAGASIRKDAPYGIRFFAQVNDAAYQKLIADENVKSVTFGMVISNDDALTFSNSFFDNFSAYEGEGYVKKELTYDQLAADKTFSISLYLSDDPMLTETGATELQKMLYACSYYKIEYNDGTVEYVFADFDATQNARSFYQVAKTYQTTYGTGNAMIDGIVSKVDG